MMNTCSHVHTHTYTHTHSYIKYTRMLFVNVKEKLSLLLKEMKLNLKVLKSAAYPKPGLQVYLAKEPILVQIKINFLIFFFQDHNETKAIYIFRKTKKLTTTKRISILQLNLF